MFVLDVVGEVDLGTSGELEAALAAVPGDVSRIVVDLARITFLDSSALNALVRQEKVLAARGVALTLVIPPGSPATEIFKLTHLTETFTIVPTFDENVVGL